MKKLSFVMITLIFLSACKKDRTCECTYTRTDASGHVFTDPMANTTYPNIRKTDAKSLCQHSSNTSVNSNGGTTTEVYDCKLK